MRRATASRVVRGGLLSFFIERMFAHRSDGKPLNPGLYLPVRDRTRGRTRERCDPLRGSPVAATPGSGPGDEGSNPSPAAAVLSQVIPDTCRGTSWPVARGLRRSAISLAGNEVKRVSVSRQGPCTP